MSPLVAFAFGAGAIVVIGTIIVIIYDTLEGWYEQVRK
jgi:hypothetical protein